MKHYTILLLIVILAACKSETKNSTVTPVVNDTPPVVAATPRHEILADSLRTYYTDPATITKADIIKLMNQEAFLRDDPNYNAFIRKHSKSSLWAIKYTRLLDRTEALLENFDTADDYTKLSIHGQYTARFWQFNSSRPDARKFESHYSSQQTIADSIIILTR